VTGLNGAPTARHASFAADDTPMAQQIDGDIGVASAGLWSPATWKAEIGCIAVHLQARSLYDPTCG